MLRGQLPQPCPGGSWDGRTLIVRARVALHRTVRFSCPHTSIEGLAHVRHRLSRGGNRQINRVLHIMAVVQLRNATIGRAYYDRRKSEGKTSMEAMRALKRRLSDVRLSHHAQRHHESGHGLPDRPGRTTGDDS